MPRARKPRPTLSKSSRLRRLSLRDRRAAAQHGRPRSTPAIRPQGKRCSAQSTLMLSRKCERLGGANAYVPLGKSRGRFGAPTRLLHFARGSGLGPSPNAAWFRDVRRWLCGASIRGFHPERRNVSVSCASRSAAASAAADCLASCCAALSAWAFSCCCSRARVPTASRLASRTVSSRKVRSS